MSIFKRIDRGDSYLSSTNSQKYWEVSGEGIEDTGIRIYNDGSKREYLEESIRHLYYSIPNEQLPNRSAYENYFQSSFDRTNLDTYPTGSLTVLSFSNKEIGNRIEPETFRWETDFLGENNIALIDNGEGGITLDGEEEIVGNIVYNHGIIVVFKETVLPPTLKLNTAKLQWKSNIEIYTRTVHCKLKNTEFNYTLNKTASDSENGEILENLKNKNFSPYITSVGLYNNNFELIAIAKLSQPIPKSKTTDTTFDIRIDNVFGIGRSIELKLGRQVEQYFELAAYFLQKGDQIFNNDGYRLFRKGSLKEEVFNEVGVDLVQKDADQGDVLFTLDITVTGNKNRGYIYRVFRRIPVEDVNETIDKPKSFYERVLDEYFYGEEEVRVKSVVILDSGEFIQELPPYLETIDVFGATVDNFGATLEAEECLVALLKEIDKL